MPLETAKIARISVMLGWDKGKSDHGHMLLTNEN